MPRARSTLVLLALPLLLLAAWRGPAVPEQDTAPLERPGRFLKDWRVCADCHDGESSLIASGTHARVPKTEGLEGCETCHGPALPHADEQDPMQITHPEKLDARAQERLCGRCHAAQLREHGGPLPELLRAGKKCSDCHQIHLHRAQVPGEAVRTAFDTRTAQNDASKPVGTTTCLGCHTDKAKHSAGGTHARFFVPGDREDPRTPSYANACESCHGNGERHVQTSGLARLITRPDRALDGNESCRQCHAEVDPVYFHWQPGARMLHGATRCTDCHEVHGEAGVHEDPALQPAAPPAALRDAAARQGRPALAHALDAHVRNQDCYRCHAHAHGTLRGTVHETLGRFDAEAGQGCVSCHPGGGAHARHGGAAGLVVSLKESSEALQRAVCLDCHGTEPEVCGHALGVHQQHGVRCLDCHSPEAGAEPAARKADANRRCTDCHAKVALLFGRPSRHPLGEGELHCSSCHDPHGQGRITPRSARRLSEACADCHREYRGPFVFAHHASKTEGCLACHVPHGSQNPLLLRTRRSRDLCLSCHADLPSFHDQSPGSVYRNCLDCHTKVHGSNRDRWLRK